MRTLLLVLGILGLVWGVNGMFASTESHSAIHEIEGLIGGLIAVCGFGLSEVVSLLQTLNKR